MKCNSEVKLFSNWQNQRPLVKYRNVEPDALMSPFYTSDAAQIEMESSAISKCIHKMSGLLDLYEQASLEYKQNYIDCHLVIKFLFEYMEMYKGVKEKRTQLIAEIKRHLKPSTTYCSMRDPLRQVCFLITEILCFYKREIFNIMKLLKPVYREVNFLSEHEQSELDQLNNRCFQIIDMYIQLNDIRNEHFQQMYDEERENAWNQQKKTWSNEILVWDSLLVKLLNSNYLLVRDKLESILSTQREHFTDRMSKFDQLAAYANEIKHDTTLQTVLYKETSHLLSRQK